jgi:hypothetical protein
LNADLFGVGPVNLARHFASPCSLLSSASG